MKKATKNNPPAKILLTSGDPAGIGPEIILKTLRALNEPSSPSEKKLRDTFEAGRVRFTVLGSIKVYDRLIKKFSPDLKIAEGVIEPGTTGSSSPTCLLEEKNGPVYFNFSEVSLSGKALPAFGKISRASGEQAFRILQKSAVLVKEKKAMAIVTAPVHKEAISLSQPSFIGHTEFYAQAFGVKDFSMAFLSPAFDLVLMTTHLGIKDLSKTINRAVILRALENAVALQKITGDKKEILVLGFNPHAGEGGLFGNEDALISKCVAEMRKKKIRLTEPLAADSAFVDVVKGKYRTVVACYHDQGLIPLKMLSKGSSVNVTLGLPFVRTSVDHGTAFDIAGTFRAEHGSMVEAILAAVRLVSA
ncbi:MAG: 4-hydroxythreonine-4-phosphate dehydrogenase PdxA [Spirochaetia bacterium]|nr:4-hydroxythreonine-4-phosphate dehydrogenase PdxA [Spirochaetia bacterium]